MKKRHKQRDVITVLHPLSQNVALSLGGINNGKTSLFSNGVYHIGLI